MIALSNLKNEERLNLPEGVKLSQYAKIYFEDIEETNENEIPEIQSDLTFYVMGT